MKETNEENREQNLSSLQQICMESLCVNLGVLFEWAKDILYILPPEQKQILFREAKVQKLLNDEILHCLLDEVWTDLDVYGSDISTDGLLEALKLLPQLTTLSFSQGNAHLLHKLGGYCPDVSCIKCSGLTCTPEDLKLLKSIFPSSTEINLDSWEDMDENPHWKCRLSNLKVLIWDDIPPSLEHFIAKSCPKVTLKSEVEAIRNDSSFEKRLSVAGRNEIPISERFRYAYILRAQRIQAKFQKERKRLANREKRLAGNRGTKNILDKWLDEEV